MSSLRDDFKIVNIQEKVKQIQHRVAELKKQGTVEEMELENKIYDEIPEFYDEYPFLVKKIISGGDISFLYKMLSTLDNVQNGKKSFAGAELELGKNLANNYLYPAVQKENQRLNEKNKK